MYEKETTLPIAVNGVKTEGVVFGADGITTAVTDPVGVFANVALTTPVVPLVVLKVTLFKVAELALVEKSEKLTSITNVRTFAVLGLSFDFIATPIRPFNLWFYTKLTGARYHAVIFKKSAQNFDCNVWINPVDLRTRLQNLG